MPMQLKVQRPRQVTTGRTQSYRVVLTLTSDKPDEDVALFVCVNEGAIPQFDHIAEAWELPVVTTTVTAETFRTSQVDLLLASKDLADALILEVVGDLQRPATAALTGTQVLSGATVIP